MKKHKGLVVFLIISILILLGFIGVYVFMSGYYKSHFFAGSTLNGIDVSNLDAKEAEEKISSSAADYLLSIYTRDDEKYNVLGPYINYRYESDGEIESIIDAQNESAWMVECKGGLDHHYVATRGMKYDEDLLDQQLRSFAFTNPDNMISPQNAYIDWDESVANYVVVSDVKGSTLNYPKTYTLIKNAIDARENSITIPDVCYEEAEITENDKTLLETIERLQSYFGHSISYKLGDLEPIVISRKEIASWLRVDEEYNITVDESRIERYVQQLATDLNTYGDRRQFVTSSDDIVTIGGGDYGWIVDKKAEKKQLMLDLASNDNVVREPVFSQRASTFGQQDYGNTYIEIDYTKQHMWYYVDGELVCDTDVVTGNINKNNGSPDGIFKIVYKEEDAKLVGEDYETKVSYFMPFAYNVGIHDASWRSEFGGNLYKSSGSHGCINAPASVVKAMYDMVEVGTPVIAYYREKVVLNAENCRISNAYSYKKESSNKKK